MNRRRGGRGSGDRRTYTVREYGGRRERGGAGAGIGANWFWSWQISIFLKEEVWDKEVREGTRGLAMKRKGELLRTTGMVQGDGM